MRDLKFYLGKASDEGPPLDLYETDEFLVFEFDLPGVDTDEVQVEVMDNVLTLEGNRKGPDNENINMRYVCMERYGNYFRREVAIPVPVKAHEGKAEYRHGVLKIVFPKASQSSVKIRIVKKDDN